VAAQQRVAEEVAPIATLLIIGTCLNGLMNVPFALQLAYQRTKIGLCINFCLALFSIPEIIFLTFQYGAIGGAAMWVTVNAIYLFVGIAVSHKYLLNGAAGPWVGHGSATAFDYFGRHCWLELPFHTDPSTLDSDSYFINISMDLYDFFRGRFGEVCS
jgi:hypothetical protein